MNLNPWLVENIEAFSFYCCPECVFRSKEESFFQSHALQNHPQSTAFFHGTDHEKLEIEAEIEFDIKQEEDDNILVKPDQDPENYSIIKEEEDINDDEGIEVPAVESQVAHENDQEGDHELELASSTKSKNDLRCEECGKQCKTQKHFTNHKYYHKYYLNGEQEFCEKCRKNIPKKLFNRHLQTVHTDEKDSIDIGPSQSAEENENDEEQVKKELECTECGKQCKSKKNLNNHMRYHKYVISGEEIKCHECDKKMPQNSLKRHMKSAHQDLFHEMDQLEDEWIDESNSGQDETGEAETPGGNNTLSKNDLTCDECGKQCKTKSSFINHKHYHKLCLTGINCEKCDRKIPKKLWQRHLDQVHTPKSPKKSKPPAHRVPKEGIFASYSDSNFRLYRTSWENFCKLSYHDHKTPPSEEMFLNYFKKKQENGRTGEYMFQSYQRLRTVFLQLFGEKFESDKVKNFIDVETEKERTEKSIEKSGICPHCGEFFKLLQQHIMYKHETNKPWKCDQCDFAHSLKQGLDGHKRVSHPDDSKMKVCHICGYKAVTNQNLKTHVEATHENKRNYSCNVCDAKFYKSFSLRNHVKVKHLGELPHKCDVCGSAFNRRDKLIKHIQLIHMDKKFPCDICGKEYSEQGSLRKHRRKYHKGLPKPQNRKQKKFDLPVGITSQRA